MNILATFFVRILSVPRRRRCLQVTRWLSSSSVRRHLSPSGTKCKDQDQNQDQVDRFSLGGSSSAFFFLFFFFFKYTYVSNHVTSDTALDVAADMSFGHRFFLVALCLGIVPSRFGHCNQGEFNEPLGGFPNLTVSVLLQCIFSADPSFQTALSSL